jgi:hypothetical protein
MSACPHRISHIHQFLDGELTPEEALELKEHLEECQDCADEMKRLEKTSGVLDEWLAANTYLPSDDFVTARASNASNRFPAVARASEVGGRVQRKKASRGLLKKLAIASAGAVIVVVAAGLVFRQLYFKKTFSHELRSTILRCSDGIEINIGDGTDWQPLRAGMKLKARARIRTPEEGQSFMSFDGIRVLADGMAELKTGRPRSLSIESGEMVVASADKKKPVEIALGKATARTNGGVLRIEREEDFVSVGVASGMSKITVQDGAAQDLVAGQIATFGMGEYDFEIARTEVINPFAQMKISAIDRARQRFEKVISEYLPNYRMTEYETERSQAVNMLDMWRWPEQMYRFASYATTEPIDLAQSRSRNLEDYYESLFAPSNRSLSIGRQKVIPIASGNGIAGPAWSHDGTMIAYREWKNSRWWAEVKVVRLDDLENPWVVSQDCETVLPFMSMGWAPDNRHVLFLTATNTNSYLPWKIQIAPIDPSEGPLREFKTPFREIPVDLPIPQGGTITPQIQKLPWGDALICANWGNLAYVPIEQDGQAVEGAPGTFLTDFNPYKLYAGDGTWSSSGSMLTFAAAKDFKLTPLSAYILYDVEDILDGFAPPPRSISDPRVRRVDNSTNTQSAGGFSFDESLVFFPEDVNNAWDMRNGTNYYPCDFDIFYADALSDQPGTSTQIHLPGSQIDLTPSPEGNRIAYLNHLNGRWELRIVSFDIEADMDMDLGGILIDNSGTNLIVPPGTLEENFGVTISTPFSVGEEAEPTEGDNTFFAMRLLNAEGLTNPQFSEPMMLTIRYTDDEVAGLDESMLDIYYYDESDPDNPAWVSLGGTVDPDYNEITVEIQHFSKFAVGGKPLDNTGK